MLSFRRPASPAKTKSTHCKPETIGVSRNCARTKQELIPDDHQHLWRISSMESCHGTFLLLHRSKCGSPQPRPVRHNRCRLQTCRQRRTLGGDVLVQPRCSWRTRVFGLSSRSSSGQPPRLGHDVIRQTRSSFCRQTKAANVRKEAGKWNCQPREGCHPVPRGQGWRNLHSKGKSSCLHEIIV